MRAYFFLRLRRDIKSQSLLVALTDIPFFPCFGKLPEHASVALIFDQHTLGRMMDGEYTVEDWKEFERRVLDDPKKSSEWADRVIDAWIRRKLEVTTALDKLEEQLLNRLPRGADLSPETFS